MDPRRRLWSVCATVEASLAGLPLWQVAFRGTSLGELLDRCARRVLLPRREITQTLRSGFTVTIPAGLPDLFSDLDAYEPETVAAFRTILRPGMTVVDVGACVGFYSLLAASLVDACGNVYAFEPNPALYPYLHKNVAANRFNQIVSVNQAVSNRDGSANFYIGTRMGTSSLRYHWGLERRPIAVRTTTLDTFFAHLNWPPVDLIKIDVEGAELSVLEGMQELCRKTRPSVVIEFAPDLLQAIDMQPVDLLGVANRMFASVTALLPVGCVPVQGPDDYPALFGSLGELRWCNLLCC